MISFAQFLEALGSPEPYPWQERFAKRCADDAPPPVIAVPTGAGKTTAVDALVWALARQADRPAAERTVGVRTVWAIDRRILVDEVHDHACELAKQLAAAKDGPLREMADRLRALAGDDAAPLVATRWRGGIDDAPALHGPLQPQIITSTVAQIGSRLLFRGYGVAEGSRALNAGLAACDTTICLDEAHLAEPFRQTVDAICRHRDASGAGLALPGLRAITITATPREDDGDAITLDDEDRRRSSELARRLTGPKRATLVTPAGTTDRDRIAALVDATLGYVRDGADTVACVVNTVRRARDVHKLLEAALAKGECGLLIGPQRPADRADFMQTHGPKLFRRSSDDGGRLVCVATQTFEVGLDADVEAMVTESASASALIQRLGRLNRAGDREGRATIVRDGQTWLYADDEPLAWEWLRSRAEGDTLDASVAALAREPKPPVPMRRIDAPELSAETVDLLAHTSRDLGAWQEIDAEVHWRGAESPPGADVAVCWRADLRPERVEEEADRYRAMLLELVPPQRDELLTLTVNAARALLAAQDPGTASPAAALKLALSDADVDGETEAKRLLDPTANTPGVPFLVLRGDDVLRGALVAGGAGTVRPNAIRPGDVIVLPAGDRASGRLGGFPHTDVAGDVRDTPTLAPVRLTPEALSAALGNRLAAARWERIAARCRHAERTVADAGDAGARATCLGELVGDVLQELSGHAGLGRLTPEALADAGRHLTLRRVGPVEPEDVPVEDDGREDGDAVDSEGPEGAAHADVPDRDLEAGWILLPTPDRRRERDERTTAGKEPPPTLDAHARAVHGQLEGYLDRLGLPERVRAALLVAALAHDHGKGDPRVQRYFRRGRDPLGAALIAKSEFGTRNPQAARMARALSGLPRGLPHEVASVAVLADALNAGDLDGDEMDRELALHLVAAHHGRGRPIPRVPDDGGTPARDFSVDAAGIAGVARGDGDDGWADGAWLERFWTVNERYGAWGVAYLEALLMLADRVVSSRGA